MNLYRHLDNNSLHAPHTASHILYENPAITIGQLSMHQKNTNKKITYKAPQKYFYFILNIYGQGEQEIIKNRLVDSSAFPPMSFFISHSKKCLRKFIYPTNQKILLLEIRINKERLPSLPYGDLLTKKIQYIEHILCSTRAKHQNFPISTNMQIILHPMVELYEDYPLKDIFYSANILELMAYSVDTIEQTMLQKNCYRARHEDKIIQAQQILEQQLCCPPSLTNLAKKIGMSLPHFKRTFRLLTGTTPCAFLKQKRMELALSLLINSASNIGEVADIVGYKSKSHFTKAFTSHFGIPPSFSTSKNSD